MAVVHVANELGDKRAQSLLLRCVQLVRAQARVVEHEVVLVGFGKIIRPALVAVQHGLGELWGVERLNELQPAILLGLEHHGSFEFS